MALMSAFAWMASQGFFLYLVVYVIFDIERYDLKQFGAICYGVGIAQTLGMYLWNGPTFFYDPGHSY